MKFIYSILILLGILLYSCSDSSNPKDKFKFDISITTEKDSYNQLDSVIIVTINFEEDTEVYISPDSLARLEKKSGNNWQDQGVCFSNPDHWYVAAYILNNGSNHKDTLKIIPETFSEDGTYRLKYLIFENMDNHNLIPEIGRTSNHFTVDI